MKNNPDSTTNNRLHNLSIATLRAIISLTFILTPVFSLPSYATNQSIAGAGTDSDQIPSVNRSSRRAGDPIVKRETAPRMRATTALWDVLYTVDGGAIAGGFFAPFLWEGDLYVSRWNPYATGNELGKIYKFEWGVGGWSNTGTITVPGVTGGYSFEGFTSDGQYIYAVNERNVIYKIDPAKWTATTISISAEIEPVGIAYDAANNGFWLIGYRGTTATLVSTAGAFMGKTLTGGYEASGIAYDDVTAGGPYLWVAEASEPALHRWNITTGVFEADVHDVTDVPGIVSEDNMCGIGIGVDTRLSKLVLLGVSESSTHGTNYIFGYDFAPASSVPPTQPQNLTATSGNGQVKLNWTAPVSDGGSAITKYQYSYGATTGYSASWDDIPSSGATTTTYTVTGLTNGTNYTFEVRAVNAAGNGASSGTQTATPAPAITLPANALIPRAFTLPGVTLPADLKAYIDGNSQWMTGSNGYGDTKYGYVFKGTGGTVSEVYAYLFNGNAGDISNIYAELYTVGNDGLPETLLGTSNPVSTADVPAVYTLILFTFSSPVTVPADFAAVITVPAYNGANSEIVVGSSDYNIVPGDEALPVSYGTNGWETMISAWGASNLFDLAIFPVVAAVSNTVDLKDYTAVADIKTAIDAALAVYSTVYVINTAGSPFNAGSPATNLHLNIPVNKTVEWNADYTGASTNPDALFNLNGLGAFKVTGGSITHTSGNGYAIQGANVNGTVMVSGGTVSTTAGTAIYANPCIVRVNGGTVSATSGYAIRGLNGSAVYVSAGAVQVGDGGTAIREISGAFNVYVSGGTVSATTGLAIYSFYSNNSITVSGGFVFAYGSKIMASNNSDNDAVIRAAGACNINPGGVGNGVVAAWNQGAGTTTYTVGTSDDLTVEPNPGATAVWDKHLMLGDGISYSYNGNTGFLPLPVTVNRIATVSNVTVSGTVGAALSTPPGAIITLYGYTVGAGWNTYIAGLSGYVDSWFTNLPNGIHVKANTTDGANTIALEFEGTPAELSSAVFAITIPAGVLTGVASVVVVESNPDAKFDIGGTFTASVSPSGIYAFSTETYGYDHAALARQFTITNTGTAPITGLNVSLGASSDFEISSPLSTLVITSGSTATFSVQPKPRLSANPTPHTDVVTIHWNEDSGTGLTVNLSFTVNPKAITVTANSGQSTYGNSPSNPGISAAGLVYGESVSVLSGLSNNFNIQATTPPASYSLEVIGNLTNSNYIVTARYMGIWRVYKIAGATVSGVPTLRDLATTDLITVSAVTIPNNPGNQTVEYAISASLYAGEGMQNTLQWQSGTTFTGPFAEGTYYVYARSAANEYYAAGTAQISDAIVLNLTGIDDVQPAKSLIAWVQNDRLYVSGLTPGTVWSVYNISGMLMYRSIAESDKADISLPARGVYIVRAGEDAVKTKN